MELKGPGGKAKGKANKNKQGINQEQAANEVSNQEQAQLSENGQGNSVGETAQAPQNDPGQDNQATPTATEATTKTAKGRGSKSGNKGRRNG